MFVLEDMEEVIFGYGRALAPLGRRLIVATTVREAKHLAATWTSEPCTCAILDERVGDGSGTEVLPLPPSMVRAQSVAVVSGFLDAWVAVRAAAMHAAAVPKPVEPSALIALVQLLEKRASQSLGPRLETEVFPRARRFDPFFLDGNELVTPSGIFHLRPADAELLAYLVDAGGTPRPARTIAIDLYPGSRDRGEQLVRRHIADLRRALGPFSALIRRGKDGGYDLATEPFRSESPLIWKSGSANSPPSPEEPLQ